VKDCVFGSVAEAEFCRWLSQWCSDYCMLHHRASCI